MRQLTQISNGIPTPSPTPRPIATPWSGFRARQATAEPAAGVVVVEHQSWVAVLVGRAGCWAIMVVVAVTSVVQAGVAVELPAGVAAELPVER